MSRTEDSILQRENGFLMILAILLFTSVVLLSALGVQNLAAYLSFFSLSYFASSFALKPRRRTIDFVGLGLVYYTLLLIAATFHLL
jgi:hypothetical protein